MSTQRICPHCGWDLNFAVRKNRYHKDGTVTYWSVVESRWIVHADPKTVDQKDLDAMTKAQREHMREMRKHGRRF